MSPTTRIHASVAYTALRSTGNMAKQRVTTCCIMLCWLLLGCVGCGRCKTQELPPALRLYSMRALVQLGSRYGLDCPLRLARNSERTELRVYYFNPKAWLRVLPGGECRVVPQGEYYLDDEGRAVAHYENRMMTFKSGEALPAPLERPFVFSPGCEYFLHRNSAGEVELARSSDPLRPVAKLDFWASTMFADEDTIYLFESDRTGDEERYLCHVYSWDGESLKEMHTHVIPRPTRSRAASFDIEDMNTETGDVLLFDMTDLLPLPLSKLYVHNLKTQETLCVGNASAIRGVFLESNLLQSALEEH